MTLGSLILSRVWVLVFMVITLLLGMFFVENNLVEILDFY